MSDTPAPLTAAAAHQALERLLNHRDAKVQADLAWLAANAGGPAATPEALRADVAAKIARRNQVLYCIGYLAPAEFRYGDIEAGILRRFPASNRGTTPNVANAVSELADKGLGILKRNPAGNAYMLKDPLFGACIRAVLRCADDSEAVLRLAPPVSPATPAASG